MPNARIHSCRSVNWKSAEPGLKRHHRSSDSANTSNETTSATRLIVPECASSSFTTNNSSAPTIGTAMSEVRIGNVTVPSSPQVIAQDRDDAEEHRRRVHPHGSVLRAAQDLAHAADGFAHAVHSAIDAAHVYALPQPFLGHDANRGHHGGIVDLVDVVLVEQQPIERRELRGG